METSTNDSFMYLLVGDLRIRVDLDMPNNALDDFGGLNVRPVTYRIDGDGWRLLAVLVTDKTYRLLNLVHDEAGSAIFLADCGNGQRPLIADGKIQVIETVAP